MIWILSKYLGFRIPILSWIPGFLELYSAFHEPNFPGFQNLESLTRGDQMIRPWLRRAKGYPHPQRFPGAKTCYPRCKKNYTLSNNKKSLKEHFTNLLCIFPTSWLATGGEPDRRRKKLMTQEPTNRQRLFYTKTKETKNFLSENRSWNNKQQSKTKSLPSCLSPICWKESWPTGTMMGLLWSTETTLLKTEKERQLFALVKYSVNIMYTKPLLSLPSQISPSPLSLLILHNQMNNRWP